MSGEIKFMKILDGNFSEVQSMIKNRQNLCAFTTHYKQHLKTTESRTEFYK